MVLSRFMKVMAGWSCEANIWVLFTFNLVASSTIIMYSKRVKEQS